MEHANTLGLTPLNATNQRKGDKMENLTAEDLMRELVRKHAGELWLEGVRPTVELVSDRIMCDPLYEIAADLQELHEDMGLELLVRAALSRPALARR